MLRTLGLSLVVARPARPRQSRAQEWAEKMFSKLDHDFGTVARGADTVYRFEITNLYKQDMHITGVRSSCGCTSPTIENPIIKTHEKAYIVARFNTRTHVGQKGATLTVTFGAPYSAEVQLHVHGNIRSDVVFNPGAIEFGEVNEGEPKEQKVTVRVRRPPELGNRRRHQRQRQLRSRAARGRAQRRPRVVQPDRAAQGGLARRICEGPAHGRHQRQPRRRTSGFRCS